MATPILPQADKAGPVLDYNGHPCRFAKLIEDRKDDDELKRLQAHDPRWVTQRLAGQLEEMNKRAAAAHATILQAHKLAAEEGDEYTLEGMLEVLSSYLRETANHAFETTTTAIVALDRAGLIAASQQQPTGAAHV